MGSKPGVAGPAVAGAGTSLPTARRSFQDVWKSESPGAQGLVLYPRASCTQQPGNHVQWPDCANQSSAASLQVHLHLRCPSLLTRPTCSEAVIEER